MKKLTLADRLLFLATVILAGYLIVVGFKKFAASETALLSVAMGVLLVAALLLLLFGFEVLENKAVVVIATITPLSLSTALVSAYLAQFLLLYSVFALLGFLIIFYTRYFSSAKSAAMILAPVHGVAGMVIFLLPLLFAFQGKAPSRFIFVGAGGALMGIGGLLLAFLKSGKPILSKDVIFRVFPALLFLTTLAFMIGFTGE